MDDEVVCVGCGDAKFRNSNQGLPVDFTPGHHHFDCPYCDAANDQYGRLIEDGGAYIKDAEGSELNPEHVEELATEDLKLVLQLHDAKLFSKKVLDGFNRKRVLYELSLINGPAKPRETSTEYARSHLPHPNEKGQLTWGEVCPDCGFHVTEANVEKDVGPSTEQEEAEYKGTHRGRGWHVKPGWPRMFFVVCVLHWLLRTAALFFTHAVAKRVRTEEVACRVMEHMDVKHGVKCKLGAVNLDTAQSTLQTARFPGKSAMKVMEIVLELFRMVADLVRSQEDRMEYDALRAAHLAFAQLLALLWTRDTGEALRQKHHKIKFACDALQEALVSWLGKGKISHYGHVLSHIPDQARRLATWGLEIVQLSGMFGESNNKAVKNSKRRHSNQATSKKTLTMALKPGVNGEDRSTPVKRKSTALVQVLKNEACKRQCMDNDEGAGVSMRRQGSASSFNSMLRSNLPSVAGSTVVLKKEAREQTRRRCAKSVSQVQAAAFSEQVNVLPALEVDMSCPATPAPQDPPLLQGFMALTVRELKLELEKCGLTKTGKKRVLAERLHACVSERVDAHMNTS